METAGKVRNSEKLPTARGLACFVLVALAASLSLLGGVATAQNPAKPKPLWQVNARKFGVPGPSSEFYFQIVLYKGTIGFQNNNTLFISWITHDGPLPHLPKAGGPTPVVRDPSHLHVLFLDAKTGARLRERELSVPSGPTGLFISHSGNLLVQAGDSLKLYTPDFVLLNQAEIPAPFTEDSFVYRPDIEISPDGRRIIVCSGRGASRKIAIFDADDLKSLGSLPDDLGGCPSELGVDSFLFNTSNGRDASQSTIRSWGNEPHNPDLIVAGHPELVRLLNGDAFIVANGSSMEVRTIDGKVLMTDTLPKKQAFAPWDGAEARDSAIFAIETTRLTLQAIMAPIPIPTHLPSGYQIAVYNPKEKRRILAINKGGDWGISQYALSPDGSFFATLLWTHRNLDEFLPITPGLRVRVYKLP